MDQPDLLPFQRRFIKKAMAPGVMTACMAIPRANGKSFLASRICADAMKTLAPHQEIALMAASIEQARIVFRFTRAMLGEKGYRYIDSATRAGITKSNGGRLRVIGSNGKTAMGLVNTPLVVADECGAWETNGGELLHDAVQTAQGKPGSPLKAVYIGTLAPMAVEGHWWHSLATGEQGAHVHAVCLQGDPEKWDLWKEILRVNPLAKVSPELRAKLKIERAEARNDIRRKARFLSYRLNVPSGDESTVPLDAAHWQRAMAREVLPRRGKPIVAIDLGHGRAWSCAVSTWLNGRVEVIAYAPGMPSIAAQEKRDRVPSGRYRSLVASGRLRVAEGLHVPPPRMLWDAIVEEWGVPSNLVCDRFKLDEMRDAVGRHVPIEPRVTQWSTSTSDILALRKLVADGPINVQEESRELLTASLSVATAKTDQSGNIRLVKSSNNTARDDACAALILGAGALSRVLSRPKRPAFRIIGTAR